MCAHAHTPLPQLQGRCLLAGWVKATVSKDTWRMLGVADGGYSSFTLQGRKLCVGLCRLGVGFDSTGIHLVYSAGPLLGDRIGPWRTACHSLCIASAWVRHVGTRFNCPWACADCNVRGERECPCTQWLWWRDIKGRDWRTGGPGVAWTVGIP